MTQAADFLRQSDPAPLGKPQGHAARNWPYHPELLDTPVPRYTSYPTAAEFTEGFDGSDLADALDAVDRDEPVSLYIHIPYCREICWYCGCNTGAANRSARLQTYLDALIQEISMVGARLAGRGRIRRIAFGGGSPNALHPHQFDLLVATILQSFACDDPVLSVEIDPRGFDADWAGALKRNGVTRASLGVQTLAPHLQQAIGRVQPHDTIREATALLRSAGIGSINFDLMYGLPGQSQGDLIETLEASLELGPDRLAVFGYAHVPHLIPRQRRIDADGLPDARARFEQAQAAHSFLTTSGFIPVGFDHFARPGDALADAAQARTLRRNFQGFTEDQAEVLIGLGASSISAFPDRLLQNEKNTGRYRARIGAGKFAATRGVMRDREDRLRGVIVEGLLTASTAQLPADLDLTAERRRLHRFEALGLARLEEDRITLPPSALPYARTIAAVFDRYRPASAARFSSAI